MAAKPVVIKFFAPVIDFSVNALMNAVEQKMKQGIKEFIITISSPGGSVFHGYHTFATQLRNLRPAQQPLHRL